MDNILEFVAKTNYMNDKGESYFIFDEAKDIKYTDDGVTYKTGSKKQWKYICDNTTQKWDDDALGLWFEDKVGNRRFFPARGLYSDHSGEFRGVGSHGFYRMSTPCGSTHGYCLHFSSGAAFLNRPHYPHITTQTALLYDALARILRFQAHPSRSRQTFKINSAKR